MNVERLSADCWCFCPAFTSTGILGESVLVSVYGFRGPEPVPVGFYELVPDDDHPSQSRREGIRFKYVHGERRRPDHPEVDEGYADFIGRYPG